MTRVLLAISLAGALTLTLGLGSQRVLAAPGTNPAPGNSAAAHDCQQGGYKSLQTSTGGTFKNTGECTSYAAQGGTLFQPTLTVTMVPNKCPACFWYALVGSGFHPNSALTWHGVENGFPGDTLTAPAQFSTNSFGAFNVPTLWYDNCVYGGVYQKGNTITGTVTLTDAQGVHASAPFSFTCP